MVDTFSAPSLTLSVGQQEEHPARKQLHWWEAGIVICLKQTAAWWLAYGPAEATATPSSLLQKIQNGLPFWYRPIQVLLEKGLTNNSVCSPLVWSYSKLGQFAQKKTTGIMEQVFYRLSECYCSFCHLNLCSSVTALQGTTVVSGIRTVYQIL